MDNTTVCDTTALLTFHLYSLLNSFSSILYLLRAYFPSSALPAICKRSTDILSVAIDNQQLASNEQTTNSKDEHR